MIKALLVDDHQLIRAGVRLLLENLGNINVVAEVSTGQDALDRIRDLQPDLILLDISLPDMSGLEVLNRMGPLLRPDQAQPIVLILSMHAQKEYVARALRAGAAGYLLKESAPDELEAAITAVLAGEQWVSPALRSLIENRRISRSTQTHSSIALSPRQIDVLRLIAQGQAVKEIAFALAISAKTVETHRSTLMEKLDIHDTAGLVRFAIRQGLIAP